MITFATELFNLHSGEEDKQKTLENVKANISFKGPNLWILACAIMVASIGLNVNSTAVIIGAMLISPLMGPIVGSGFALGIYDFDLLKKSLKNLFIATIVALLVSSIYFYLSPFKDVQSELLARTSPNIYDVLIAFFGGLVGVITITRVEKGNPLPGVAIATALMPPLCTAGFGLATGNYKFFFGALFLYFINCVFICISTFIIVKYLKYPAIKEVDIKHQQRIKYGISFIITLMLLPSAYFAYSLYKEQQFKHAVDIFIERELVENGKTVIYKKSQYNSKKSKIELAFLENSFSDKETLELTNKLKQFGLVNTELIIKKNSIDNINSLKNDLLNEVSKKDLVVDQKDKMIQSLEKQLKETKFDNKQLLIEIKTIFPNINTLSVAKHSFAKSDTVFSKSVLIYKANPELSTAEKKKISNWVQKRLSLKNLDVINIEQ